jgi:hypothetical protein
MDFITDLQQRMMQQLPELMRQYEGDIFATSLSEMETSVKQMTHELGNAILQEWLEAQEQKYPADEKSCPHCGEQAKYVRRRKGMSITLQGRVYYRRCYYLCESCQGGFYPLDQELGINSGEMSSEVIQLAALMGIEGSFGSSQDKLARTSLLELSPNSIRKATLKVGQVILEQEQVLLEHSHNLEAQREQKRDTDKPQRLYGSIDGFMVLLEDGWHEMKAGAWWTTKTNRRGEIKAENIRYYTDLLPACEFSDLVWATGFDQKADQALELVFVADAADWIWRIVQQHYPQATQIVDWYHACAYITPVAQAVFQDKQQQKQWITQVKTALWNGQLDVVIAACREHLNPQREDDPAQKAVTYYTNNRQRMDYATYRDKGYQIGSGSMESACKQIGLARLKIAGARWSKDGVRRVAKARAAYLSGDWDKINISSHTLPLVA